MKVLFLILISCTTFAQSTRQTILRGSMRQCWSQFQYYNTVDSSYHTLADSIEFKNLINAKQAAITTGTTAQYFKGDLSLGTFPTALSAFTNDGVFITAAALSPYQLAITTGTTAQYFRGDLSLATFPTTTAAFTSSTNKNFVTDAQLTVIGNTSGTNTGDQTNISGNSATSTTLQNARLINGVSFNGSVDIATTDNLLAYQALGSPFLAQTVDFPLTTCNTALSLVDNQTRFTAVYLPKAATLTGIRLYVRTLGAYTGDQNNRVGLYTYSAGTLTLVASSANNASLWTSAANAFQTIPFSGTYSAAAGLYFVCVLYNNSAQTTAPAFASGTALNNLAMASLAFTNSAKLYGTVAAQNDLPGTQASSGITAVTAPLWVVLY